MKVRTDILRLYKDVHSWVGIVAGLALFIGFYAGAITMFEEPLQRWASPPTRLAPPPSLDRTPELVAKAVAAHPEIADDYDIVIATGPERPARLTWDVPAADDHDPPQTFYASLAPDGTLQVETRGPSEVAQFVDTLHQQVGLPFAHEISMPIMGAIALLYVIAIVSGLIVLLPSLVSDLFALRIGKNAKRMWLDLHNVLGVFSLPFHLIMALTAIVFAYHDQFYDAQDVAFGGRAAERPAVVAGPPETRPVLAPAQVVARLAAQMPGFTPIQLGYHKEPDGRAAIRVMGHDPRYGHRAPTYGLGEVDAYDGRITETDYLPGRQDNWSAVVTSFFALHFGNFGGAPVRWSYFLLGLAGAFIFYTGNLLWIESRRKRERKSGAVEQTRATRILGALTVGGSLGCVAGLSVTIAAAKPLGEAATYGVHSAIFYAVFLGFTAWALARGAARAGVELLLASAAAMLLIPAASLVTLSDHWPDGGAWLVDAVAIAAAMALVAAARAAHGRARSGGRDSIWSGRPSTPGVRADGSSPVTNSG